MKKEGIRLYELYPYLFGDMSEWAEHLEHIKKMNFNWININSFHQTDKSNYLYSIKNHFVYNPELINMDNENIYQNKEIGDEYLFDFCRKAEQREMSVMMDVVLNNISKESDVFKLKPEWFKKLNDSDYKTSVMYKGTEIIDCDNLVEYDLDGDYKEQIYNYLCDYMIIYIRLGIKGFRVKSAHAVNANLLLFLLRTIKRRFPEIIFIADIPTSEIEYINESIIKEFDFVNNDMKWWNYKDHWFLPDYEKLSIKANTIASQEAYDEDRLAKEKEINPKSEILAYAIQAYFCSSICMTVGFEYGYIKKINTFDIKKIEEDHNYDLSDKISYINNLKKNYKILSEETEIYIFNFESDNVFSFLKESKDRKETILVVANLNMKEWQEINIPQFSFIMRNKKIKDLSHGHDMDSVTENLNYFLQPGEVKLFYAKK